MTKEEFEKACRITSEIRELARDIGTLKSILKQNPLFWKMQIHSNFIDNGYDLDEIHSNFIDNGYDWDEIDHLGLLPDFLQQILEKQEAKLKKLEDELAAL